MGNRLSIKEAASRLGYSTSRVYQFIADGRLEAYQLNRQYKIEVTEEAVADFIKRRRRPRVE